MKDAYFFSHDSNARNDLKILAMRNVYGMEGYGWFWVLVELLREQERYRLKISDKFFYHSLASQLQNTKEISEKFINDCIKEFDLFKTDGESIWSDSLNRRMEHLEEVREKRKKAAEIRWDKQNNANASKKHANASKMNACAMQNSKNGMQVDAKESKVKESKVKESKVKESKVKESKVYSSAAEKLLYNEEFKKIISCYEQNIKPTIMPAVAEGLNKWFDEISADLIMKAIKEAALNDAKSMNYINQILINWNDEGLKTIEQVNAYLQAWNDKKKVKKSSEPAKNKFSNFTQDKPDFDNLMKQAQEKRMKEYREG